MGVAAYVLLHDHDATVPHDVVIVGGGVAGCSTGIYTARVGLDTLIVDGGESGLARAAHLENYPGFPGGIDARRFLGMVREQAERAGCEFAEGRVTGLERDGDAFVATAGDDGYRAERVVAASRSDVTYLQDLDVETSRRDGEEFVDVDGGGRTSVEGLYAAGRIAGRPHQAVVAAGHGAAVGIAVADDSEVSLDHDWVVPEGHFTGRGREVPPGCEEIDGQERRRREAASREALREHLAGAPEGEPTTHPSVAEDDR